MAGESDALILCLGRTEYTDEPAAAGKKYRRKHTRRIPAGTASPLAED